MERKWALALVLALLLAMTACSGDGGAEDADALAVRFPSLGFFKTYAALHVLLELNLVHYEQYRDQLLLCVSDAQGKTDLASSPLYALLEGVKG